MENRIEAKDTGNDTLEKSENPHLPDDSLPKSEPQRKKRGKRLRRALRCVLCISFVTAVLIAALFVPVLRINGSSMSPAVNEGEIVVLLNGLEYKQGDILALTYENKLLLRRYIAGSGQQVDIDANGDVFVDGLQQVEPQAGEDTKMTDNKSDTISCTVPDGKFFVLGDNREVCQDSRSEGFGCVSEEQIIGKAVFRVWPLLRFGPVK